MRNHPSIPNRLLTTTTIAGMLALALTVHSAQALPVRGEVRGGQARIASRAGRTAVTQSSQRAVIDWGSFNVSRGETVQFVQPNASSITLNRVNRVNPSVIDGTVTANGQVWLINANGIAFGKNAQVNVGGLLATTSDIDNSRFMAGDYTFNHPGNATATISNAGTLQAVSGGLIALAGPNVSNSGIITAKLGKVQMASGDAFTVDLYGDGLINLQAGPEITQQLVANSGTIKAQGGQVLLTAAAAETVVNSLINLNGVIDADSVGAQQGSVTLSAGGGSASVSGTVDVSGKGAGQVGGNVTVTGNSVTLLSGSAIDARGDAGGGYVKIGGDFHGEGTTPHARTTTMQPGATIDASAITSGDGGKVALWSDQQTDFEGTITARGGSVSGDGGYVETSGHTLLAVGSVNAGAPNGNAGNWLLDPNDITINQSSCTGTGCSTADSISTSLSGGTNVAVTTTNGDITLSGNITDTGNSNTTLTFSAGANINFSTNDSVTNTGTGKLNVTLDSDLGGSSGYIYLNSGANITTNGGSIILGGGNGPISAGSGYAVGSATYNSQYGIYIADTLNATGNATVGGNIIINGAGGTTVNASGGSNNYGIYLNGGTIQTSGSGTITLTGTSPNTADTTGGDMGIFMASGNITSSGAGLISLTGTGGGSGNSHQGNYGIYIAGGTIAPTGAAPITVTSTPGYGTVFGLTLNTSSPIVSAGGTVTLVSSSGIYLNTGNITYATGTSYELIMDAGIAGTGGGISLAGNISTNGGDIILGGGLANPANISAGNGYVVGDNGGNWQVLDITSTSTINAGGGNIIMNGQATGSAAAGIYINGTIETKGAGNITLNGIGNGSGGSGISSFGGTIQTLGSNATGTIELIGSRGNGTGTWDILLDKNGTTSTTVTSGGSSPIIFIADGSGKIEGTGLTTGGGVYSGKITIEAESLGSFTSTNDSIQTAGTIQLEPYTASSIGVDGASGTLSLSSTTLGAFTSWGTLIIGGGNTTNITANADSTRLNTGSVELLAGGNITLGGAWGKSAGSADTLTLSAGGNISVASYAIGGASGSPLSVIMDSGNTGSSGSIVGLGNITTYGGDIYLGGGPLDGNGHPTAGYSMGTSASGSQYGLYLNGVTLNAGGGNISLLGEGGTYSSGADDGIYAHGSTIETSGSGSLTLIGLGGTNTSGTNYGVYLDKNTSASTIASSGSGAITVTGVLGSGGTNYGVGTDANSDVIGAASGYSGNIALQADSLSLGTGTSIKTSGNIQVEPYTATTAVNVATGGTGLQLTGAYLGYLNGGSLTIGNASDSGLQTLGTYGSWNTPVTFLTKSTGGISVSGDQTATGCGSFTFTGGPLTLSGNLTTAGGNITLNPAVTLGQNETIGAGGGTVTFGSTVNGAYNLTASAGTFSMSSAWGGTTALSAVSLTSTNSLSLPAISAASIFAQTTGGASDLTLTGQLAASGANTAVTLVSARNFINADGTDGANSIDLTGAGSPRWLIYSINPANNIINGLAESLHRYSCSYGGSCPSFPATGNGDLYSLSPTITVTANNDSGTYGSIAAFSASYSGFINGDSSGAALSGAPSLTTNATTSSSANWNAGTWTITSAAGTLTSPLGYQLSYANGTLSVAQKSVSISGVAATNKVYDSTTADALNTGSESLTGKVTGDNVSIGNGTGAFSDANVNVNKTVAASGFSLTGADAADYSLSGQPSGLTANITPAGLTVTARNVTMTYADGTPLNGTTGFTTSGLLGSDSVTSVTLSTNASLSTSGNYNAGTWTLNPSAASGSGLSNYSITYDNASTGLTIAQKALAVTGVSGTNKVYDSTTTDSVTGTASLSGKMAGDVVTINNGTASFGDANVGNNKTVTFSGYGIGGADAADYSLSQPASSTANITAAGLTITAANQNQTYGFGGTSAELGTTGFTTSGLLGSDSVSSVMLSTNASTGTSGNYNAGTWRLTPSAAAGSGLSNYSITYDDAPVGLTIAQKALAITGLSGTNKVYDSTDADPVTGMGTLSGIVQGVGNGGGTSDVLTLNNGSASFANPNVGNGKTVTFSGYSIGGADAGDYALSQPASSTANITARALTITAGDQSQTYGFGGSSAALGSTGFTVSGLLGSDSVSGVTLSTNATTSTSGNYNVSGGTPWTLTPSAAGGTGLSNYTIIYANAPSGLTVTPLAITVGGGVGASNKVYDATTGDALSFSSPSLSGVIGSEAVSINQSTGSGTFADANAGNGKAVTVSGLGLSGHDAANYTLIQPSGVTASVTPASLTVTANDLSKSYGSADPAFTYTAAGLQGSDTAGSVLSGSLTRNPGENVGTYAISQGILASNTNYTLSFTPGTLTITTANILAVEANNETMTYGGSLPALTYTYSGLVNGDTSSVFSGSMATTATSSSNVGTYVIRQGSLSAGGNYLIDYVPGRLTVTAVQTAATPVRPMPQILSTFGQANNYINPALVSDENGVAPPIVYFGNASLLGTIVPSAGDESRTRAAGKPFVAALSDDCDAHRAGGMASPCGRP